MQKVSYKSGIQETVIANNQTRHEQPHLIANCSSKVDDAEQLCKVCNGGCQRMCYVKIMLVKHRQERMEECLSSVSEKTPCLNAIKIAR